MELVCTCGLRVCPLFQRLETEGRIALLARALPQVSEYTRARRDQVVARLAHEFARAEHAIEWWTTKLATWRRTAPGRAWASQCLARAEERRRKARWQYERCTDPTWGWKVLTFSTRWKPSSLAAQSIEGKRRSIARTVASFVRTWHRGLKVGGLASVLFRVEQSDHGFVHGHALLYAPFVTERWLTDQASDGGRYQVHVRIRDAHDLRRTRAGARSARDAAIGAALECAKYAVKDPSPLRADWFGNLRRWRVTHAASAVNFMLAAWRRHRLYRVHGPLADAIANARAQRDPDRATVTCACCNADITACGALPLRADVIARVLGPEQFHARTSIVRAPRIGGRDRAREAGLILAALARLFRMAGDEAWRRDAPARQARIDTARKVAISRLHAPAQQRLAIPNAAQSAGILREF